MREKNNDACLEEASGRMPDLNVRGDGSEIKNKNNN